MNHFKKILVFLQNLFRRLRAHKECSCHPAAKVRCPAGRNIRPCRSAEGWELVHDFDNPHHQSPAQRAAGAASNIAPGHAGKLHSSLPPYPVVWVYFTVNDYPEVEALRFYRRYQVLGWNARIIATLTDWQQLADHWMLQAGHPPKHNSPKPPPHDNHSGRDNLDT